MSSVPAVSIIVPTCGRPDALRRLFGRLSWQACAPSFEVVVALDGVSAEAAGVASVAEWPFPVRLMQVRGVHGAAAARNLGASVARAPVLLFLDDDVEPGPGVVATHARLHTELRMAIGAGSLAPRPVCTGYLEHALAGWWDVMNGRLADPRHRFSFRDVLTGHCSMERSTFDRIGPFDETLRCHEDFEFGIRALECGADIRFARGAEAEHCDASDLTKILRRKRDEGIADVQLAAMHPSIVTALPLGRTLADLRWAAVVHRLALLQFRALDLLVPAALRSLMWMFERLSMRDKWRAALERAMDHAYWSGVRAEAGSTGEVRRIRAAARVPAGELLDVDLLDGLPVVEARLDRVRPAGVRVSIGRELVGELVPEPGTEPLKGMHLRPLLLKGFAGPFTQAAARAGLLPPVLQACVARASARDRCGTTSPP